MNKKNLTRLIALITIITLIIGIGILTTDNHNKYNNNIKDIKDIGNESQNIDNNSTINSNEGENITLIKAEVSGKGGWKFNSTESYYDYYVKGVLKNLPSNIKGYDLKANFYDENGKFVHEGGHDLKYIVDYSANNEVSTIASFEVDNTMYNISKIVITIDNPEGKIVFNETVDFDMEKMDLTNLESKPKIK